MSFQPLNYVRCVCGGNAADGHACPERQDADRRRAVSFLVGSGLESDVLTPPPAQVAASVPPAAPGATESASGSPSACWVLSEAEMALLVGWRRLAGAPSVDGLLAVVDRLAADGARLRERIAALASEFTPIGSPARRLSGWDVDRRLRALLAPEDDAPAAAQCEDCEHSGHLPGGCEDYSDEPPDGGPCECMTDSTDLRALLTDGGE